MQLLHSFIAASSIVLLLGCCTPQKNATNEFLIQGNLMGKDLPSVIVLSYEANGKHINDTAKVSAQGTFAFKGVLSEPTIAGVNLTSDVLWLEPTSMTLDIDVNTGKATLSGSKTHNDQQSYYQYTDSVITVGKRIALQIDSLKREEDAANSNSPYSKNIQQQTDSLMALLQSPQFDLKQIQFKFIQNHPHSLFSAYLLYPHNASELLPTNTIQELLTQLEANVRESHWGQKIMHDLTLRQKSAVGEIAPNFKGYDPIHHDTLTLSKLQGKVILLDFWAHWCGPCRKSFTHLKELYQQHHPKGLEIVAVYTDKTENHDDWIKAINEENIQNWHHIKIAENLEDDANRPTDIRANYYVQAIPRKVLIGKDQRIIKFWVGHSTAIDAEVTTSIQEALSQK